MVLRFRSVKSNLAFMYFSAVMLTLGLFFFIGVVLMDVDLERPRCDSAILLI